MADDQKTVLLAEDDMFLSQLLSTRLARAGVNVIKASDGEQILKILETTKPDLILLDIILPRRSGFEVMEQMQSNPLLQKAPVVIISNLGQENDIARGKQLGALGYYVKAKTSIEDLIVKIQQFLENPNTELFE
jgi:DNA-binding response OmpR family regulator